ncbi:MAG: hypothetical protein WA191_23885 [Telluria sp.]|nr:hypothetical protein [Telluria sp.]
MADKALATRQKMRFHVEPSQQAGKPRNRFAVAARQRSAGPHAKGPASQRQAAKRALAKIRTEPED